MTGLVGSGVLTSNEMTDLPCFHTDSTEGGGKKDYERREKKKKKEVS